MASSKFTKEQVEERILELKDYLSKIGYTGTDSCLASIESIKSMIAINEAILKKMNEESFKSEIGSWRKS